MLPVEASDFSFLIGTDLKSSAFPLSFASWKLRLVFKPIAPAIVLVSGVGALAFSENAEIF